MPSPDDRDKVSRTLAEAGLRLVAAGDDGQEWLVDGPTYPQRELIRQQGGRWSGSRRRWYFRFGEGPVPVGLSEAAPHVREPDRTGDPQALPRSP